MYTDIKGRDVSSLNQNLIDGGRGRFFQVVAMKSSNPQRMQGKNYIPTHNLRGA